MSQFKKKEEEEKKKKMSEIRFNPFPAFGTSQEVCGKVHSVQFVCCCGILLSLIHI